MKKFNRYLFVVIFIFMLCISCREVKWDEEKAKVVSEYYPGRPEIIQYEQDTSKWEFSCSSGLQIDNDYVRLIKEYYVNGNLRLEYAVDKYKHRYGKYYVYYESGKIMETGEYSGKYDYGDACKINKCIRYFENGSVMSIAPYKKNRGGCCLHGMYKEFYDNSVLKYTAKYKKNFLNGMERKYSEKGKLIQETFYKHDKKHGKSIEYFEDSGKISGITHYNEGVKEGPEVYYYPDNTKRSYREYKEGRLYGTATDYHSNGRESYRVFYYEGLPEGREVSFFEDGKLQSEVAWNKGKRDGKSIHYRTDGTPYNVIIYTGGNMEESTEYRDNGKPLKTIKYKIGEIIQYDENGEIAGKEPFETNIYDEYGEY